MRAAPQIMLNAGAHDALRLWQRAFPDLSIDPIAIDGDDRVTHARVRLADLDFTLFQSPVPHAFGPTPAVSMLVAVDRADDVDEVAKVLAEGGEVLMPIDAYEFARRYVWVADRFGVSWQIMFEG